MRVHRLAFALLLTACAAAGPVPAAEARPPARALSLGDLSGQLEGLAARVGPAVVEIHAAGYAPSEQPTRVAVLTTRQALGSGVILSSDGYIVTNHHVIRSASRLEVQLPAAARPGAHHSVLRGAGPVLPARLVGTAPETDLAVLKVERTGLPTVTLADSDALRSGQIVLAFGSPLGLEGSVTMGIVSTVARQLEAESPVVYVQTDAPINPGNSGGALCDVEGRLVGINTLIASKSGGSEGLGFAVPSNIVRAVTDQLRTSGRVRRGILGLLAQTVTPELARGLKLARTDGVLVGDVYPGGPAAAAGVRPGDLVLALDEKAMENARQLDVNVYRKKPGEKVKVKVLRQGKELELLVSVIERQDDPMRFGPMVDPARNLLPRLGVLGLDMRPEIVAMFRFLRSAKGVVVAAAAREIGRGLQPGDVIHAADGVEIENLADLRGLLSKQPQGATLGLHVERNGRLFFTAVELGD